MKVLYIKHFKPNLNLFGLFTINGSNVYSTSKTTQHGITATFHSYSLEFLQLQYNTIWNIDTEDVLTMSPLKMANELDESALGNTYYYRQFLRSLNHTPKRKKLLEN